MSKQVKDSVRTPRAKTGTRGEYKRRGSLSRTRKTECRYGSECEDLKSPSGCNFWHSPEEVEATRHYRPCAHGMDCDYITENDDSCPYNHGDFQRGSKLPEPSAKVEEVTDAVVSSAGPKKTNKKNKGVKKPSPASASDLVASPVAASSSASASASCVAEVQREIIKLDLKLELLQAQMEYFKTQMEEIRNSRDALFARINNPGD